jgi:hypothetical protein
MRKPNGVEEGTAQLRGQMGDVSALDLSGLRGNQGAPLTALVWRAQGSICFRSNKSRQEAQHWRGGGSVGCWGEPLLPEMDA